MSEYDVITQQDEIGRRRKLLQALQQQAAETPITGNTGLGQALAKLGTAWLTSSAQKDLAVEESANRAAYGAQLGQETTSYLDKMQGKPGQQMDVGQVSALLEGDQAPQLADPVKANPREAVTRAMSSRLPEMQAIGKAGMGSLNKTQMTQEDFLKLSDMSPESRIKAALSGQIQDLSGKESVHTVGGQLLRLPGQGAPTVVFDGREKFDIPGRVGFDPSTGKALVGQRESTTGKVTFAPQGTNVNIDTQGNKFALEATGKVLEGARDSIIKANQARQTSERIYNLSKDPQVMQGFGAGVGVGLQAVASKLNLVGPEGVAKTQALMTDLAAQTLARGEQMKGTFSDKDIVFLKQVSAGSIELTPEVIQHVAGLSMSAAHNTIMDSTQQYNSATNVQGAGEITKLYPIPPRRYSIPDDGKFTHGDDGRITFNSPLGNNVAKPAVLDEAAFMKKYFPGGQ